MVFSDRSEKITWWQETATMLHNRDPKGLDRLLKLANTMLTEETQINNKLKAPKKN